MTQYSIDIGEVDIDLNPHKLGELFAKMDSQEQMRFLNGFSTFIDEKWAFQCRAIQEEYDMNDFMIMKQKAADALTVLVEHLEEGK